MITKEQLQAMSDFEVNKVLTKLVTGYGLPASCCLDYCNNPSDIMPLAFEHGISLIKLDSAWAATNNPGSYITDSIYRFNEVGGVSDWNENPLRAIACCLILVLQEQQK